MPSISKIFSSQVAHTIEVVNGKVSEKHLYALGKTIPGIGKKFSKAIERCFLRLTFQFAIASQSKRQFYLELGQDKIKELNINYLNSNSVYGHHEDVKHYAIQILDKGEILVPSSKKWKQISNYFFIQQVKKEGMAHWLSSFDLGDLDNALDPANIPLMHRLKDLEALSKKYSHPDFVPYLQRLLEKNRNHLLSITEDEVSSLETLLSLSADFSQEVGLADPAKMILLAELIKESEKNPKGETDSEQKTLRQFLKESPLYLSLLLDPTFSKKEEVREFSTLCSKINSPANHLLMLKNLGEINKSLKIKNQEASFAERFGEAFAKDYQSKMEAMNLSEPLKELEKIEEIYRYSGKEGDFIANLTSHFVNHYQREDQFVALVEKFQKKYNQEISRLGHLNQAVTNFLDIGVNPKAVKQFRSKVIENLMQSKDFTPFLQEQIKTFNREQLEEERNLWKSFFGEEVADALFYRLDESVQQGRGHFKIDPDLKKEVADLSTTYAAFGGDAMREEFGTALVAHLILHANSSSITQEEKNRLKENKNHSLNILRQIRQEFIEKGIEPKQFDKLFNSVFLRRDDDRSVFSAEGQESLRHFFQHKVNQKRLDELYTSHGKQYSDALLNYLKEFEPEALNGQRDLAETQIMKVASLEEQVNYFLLPYLIDSFGELKILDEALIKKVIVKAGLTPKELKTKLEFLNLLREVAPPSKQRGVDGSRRTELRREMIKAFYSPYLEEKNRDEIKGVLSAIKKFVSFAEEVDPNKVYSAAILALSVANYTEAKSKKDPEINQSIPLSLNELIALGNECTSTFNKKSKKAFRIIAFKNFLEDCGRKECEKRGCSYSSEARDLIKGLGGRFVNSDTIRPTESSKAYVEKLAEFCLDSLLNSHTGPHNVLEAISYAANREKTIFFDLKEISKKSQLDLLDDVKIGIREKLQNKKEKKVEGLIGLLRQDPFAVIDEIVPNILEGLLPKEDIGQIEKLKITLEELKPHFNQSEIVKKGIKKGTAFLSLLQKVSKKEISLNTAEAIVEGLFGVVDKLSKIDLEELKGLEEQNRDRYRQSLEKRGAGLAATFGGIFTDMLFDAHTSIQSEDFNPETASGIPLLVNKVLPQLLSQRDKIEAGIKKLPFLITLTRRIGAGFLVNRIIKKFLSKQLEESKFDDATKEMVLKGIETIIKTGLLAGPEVLKRHSIGHYFDLLEKIDREMKKEVVNPDALFLIVTEIVKEGATDLLGYEAIITEAIKKSDKELFPK